MNANTTEKITFSAHTIAAQDRIFPVEYSILPDETVIAFLSMSDGEKTTNVRIKVAADHAQYSQALAAAKEEREEREQVRAAARIAQEQTAEEPEQVKSISQNADAAQAIINEFCPASAVDPEPADQEPAPEAEQPEEEPEEQPEAPADDAKKARGPVPKKEFVGLEIKGKGWKIAFDGSYGRTRVIFKRMPSDRVREAVKAAGFFWSPVMKSWNKKLTFKAFMAAQDLAIELRKLCA